MLAITVARPAPTASIEWCQNVRSAAKNTPGTEGEEVVAPPERAEAPALDPGEHPQHRQRVGAAEHRRGGGRDLGQPNEDGREGDHEGAEHSRDEGPLVHAAAETSHGYGPAPMDRNSLLWTLVLFFGASVMFTSVRNVTGDESYGVQLAAQAAAGLLLVGRDRGLR